MRSLATVLGMSRQSLARRVRASFTHNWVADRDIGRRSRSCGIGRDAPMGVSLRLASHELPAAFLTTT